MSVIERIARLTWLAVVLAFVCLFLIYPTYEFGIIGWFCGWGILLNIALFLWIIEAAINYIKTGEFKPEDWD